MSATTKIKEKRNYMKWTTTEFGEQKRRRLYGLKRTDLIGVEQERADRNGICRGVSQWQQEYFGCTTSRGKYLPNDNKHPWI